MKKAVIVILSLIYLSNCGSERRSAEEKLPHFVFGENDAPGGLDPRYNTFIIETRLYFGLFEGLVTYDPLTLEPIPGVAESWEISEDGLTYTFHLREDARWSDGTQVTAEQFVDTWLERLSPYSGNLDFNDMIYIKGTIEYSNGETGPETVAIRALDERILQFELYNPTPFFLTMLPYPCFFVLPQHVIKRFGDQWTAPDNFVSNGPFIIETHIEGERIVLSKSSSYWDRDNVKLGKITVLFISDYERAFEMFQAGELDWIPSIPAGRTSELLTSPTFHLSPSFTTYFYWLNMRETPLDDVRVRQALAYTLNRRKLVETILEGSRIPAYNLTPPLPSYQTVRGIEEDPEEARELLAEAGYPGGKGMKELLLTYNYSVSHENIARFCAETWKRELGINVSLKPLHEWEDFISSLTTHSFEMQRGGWYGHYLDPNSFLDIFVTESPGNCTGMSNSRYDKLIKEANNMKYGQERFDLLREAEEILLHDELPVIPFYFYMHENCIDTSVWGGWYENVMDWHPWKWIYRKEK